MTAHQRKPNQWSCSITALAMALNTRVSEIIKEAGHDGSEIIFPALPEPQCRKGFHSQEAVRIAWAHGYSMTPVELCPMIMSTDQMLTHPAWDKTEDEFWERFKLLAGNTYGILAGRGFSCYHAVYYDHGVIYDPDPDVAPYGFSKEECKVRSFYPQCLWVFSRRDYR